MTPQIDSKSAETADRLRRIMGSLIELNMRIEKQEELMSDHKLQKNIRGSGLTRGVEVLDSSNAVLAQACRRSYTQEPGR